MADRPDAPRRQQDIDATAGAEVEDCFARCEIGDRDWVAAAEACESGAIG